MWSVGVYMQGERRKGRAGMSSRGRTRECDTTTKWDQEGILSCSCVPITPPGNICFISVTKATRS